MRKFLQKFRRDQKGAATIGWVTLTASTLAFAVGVLSSMDGAMDSTLSNIVSGMTGEE